MSRFFYFFRSILGTRHLCVKTKRLNPLQIKAKSFRHAQKKQALPPPPLVINIRTSEELAPRLDRIRGNVAGRPRKDVLPLIHENL